MFMYILYSWNDVISLRESRVYYNTTQHRTEGVFLELNRTGNGR